MENVEIVKFFQEQMSVMQELLEEKIIAEVARVVAEINIHQRDKHNGYWDPTYYLEGKKKYDEKREELYKKLEENKKKIAELIKASDTSSTGHPAFVRDEFTPNLMPTDCDPYRSMRDDR